MVTPQSPTRMFNGLEDDLYNEAKFAHEINDRMRVPKRIKATGEYSDEDPLLSNQNGVMLNSWNYHDKIDMNVPDRIVVLGHNQHLETRSAPREIQLENSILPKNPSSAFVRVQTPPRTITLNEHHFPSASEESSPNKLHNGDDLDIDDDFDDDVERPPPYVRANGMSNVVMGFHTNDANSVESDSQVGQIFFYKNLIIIRKIRHKIGLANCQYFKYWKKLKLDFRSDQNGNTVSNPFCFLLLTFHARSHCSDLK